MFVLIFMYFFRYLLIYLFILGDLVVVQKPKILLNFLFGRLIPKDTFADSTSTSNSDPDLLHQSLTPQANVALPSSSPG
jgi:hypothetical protein